MKLLNDTLHINTTTITIPGAFTGTGQLIVFNTFGLPVKTVPFIKHNNNELNKTIDLSDLQPGIYIIRCKTGNKQRSKKIVKK